MKSQRIFEVPIRHVGNGPGGYLLKEIIATHGKNAVKATKDVRKGMHKANYIRNPGY